MQQLFTTEDTESTEKSQSILINGGRDTGSSVQSDGLSDFSFFVGFTEKGEKPLCMCDATASEPVVRPFTLSCIFAVYLLNSGIIIAQLALLGLR